MGKTPAVLLEKREYIVVGGAGGCGWCTDVTAAARWRGQIRRWLQIGKQIHRVDYVVGQQLQEK